jgi:hypothetical protein
MHINKNGFVPKSCHILSKMEMKMRYYDVFTILISSFGWAMILPHFSHSETCKGSYTGMKTLTFGSGEFCSTTTLFTGTLFQWPHA